MFFDEIAQLEVGLAHLDAKCLGFGAPGYRAAIIIGEDNDRPAFQLGFEYPLTGNVKVYTQVDY